MSALTSAFGGKADLAVLDFEPFRFWPTADIRRQAAAAMALEKAGLSLISNRRLSAHRFESRQKVSRLRSLACRSNGEHGGDK